MREQKAKAVSDEEAIKGNRGQNGRSPAESTRATFEARRRDGRFWFSKRSFEILRNLELGLKYLKAKAETAEDKAQAELQIEQTEAQIRALETQSLNRVCAFWV